MTNLRRNDVLAIVAHELRSPLGSILNAVELILESEADGRSKVASRLEMIRRQTTYMSRLVDDLIDVARMTRQGLRLCKERLDLRTPVEAAIEVTRPMIEMRGHKLNVELASRPIWIDGDATRLQQVVVNLLVNSAEYTRPGGEIYLKLEEGIGLAVLRVRDTGIGILPDALERIFEPFIRDRSERGCLRDGLGIGLAVVRNVVERHGGAVEVTSPGLHRGSEFVVRLPTLSAEPPPIVA